MCSYLFIDLIMFIVMWGLSYTCRRRARDVRHAAERAASRAKTELSTGTTRDLLSQAPELAGHALAL
jgi:hypothetical protein